MTTILGTPTAATPSAVDTPGARHASLWRDCGLVFSRGMRLSLRNPVWLVMGLAQPLLYLFLFGPLLTKISGGPGFPPGDPWQIFVPALMVMLGLFGAAFVGFGLISEWRDGVIDRMRVTPMSRFALLAGRVLRDLVVLAVQAVLLVLAGVVMGLRAPLVGIAVGIVIVLAMGATMSAASYAVALTVKSEDALAPLLNGVMLPVMLLSGIMLPITQGFAPGWLFWLSRINPMAYVVDAARAAFLGDFTSHHFWIGLGVAAVLAAVGLTLATRTFTRQSR
jgi:ABC-2 type transport system permease protein